MANHKSAAKRATQALKKNARNSQTKKTIRSFEKKLRTAISAKDSTLAKELLVAFSSKMDKAAQKGILHAKTASRKISRLASQVSSFK